MFVHAQSYEDLTSTENHDSTLQSTDEGEKTEVDQTKMEQISKDFSELSTQLTGITLDLEEEIRQSKEDKLDLSPQGSRQDSALSGKEDEDVTMDAWRRHRKHIFVLSEAGKPVYSRYGSEEALSSTMGVMMALVSFLEAEKNAIRSIHAGIYYRTNRAFSPAIIILLLFVWQTTKVAERQVKGDALEFKTFPQQPSFIVARILRLPPD